MRKRWKSGKWLVTDQESGVIDYSDKMTEKDYFGRIIRTKYADKPQPQDFIKPLNDPRPLPFYSPINIGTVCDILPLFIGDTKKFTNFDQIPAWAGMPKGIGNMEIGCSFWVSPNTPVWWENNKPVGIGDMCVGSTFVVR